MKKNGATGTTRHEPTMADAVRVPLRLLVLGFLAHGAVACTVPEALRQEEHPEATATASEHRDQLPYQVSFKGQMSNELQDLMQRSSQLVSLQDKPPHTFSALKKRGNSDLPRFTKVLRSEGHFDGNVRFSIDQAVTPPIVTVEVEPGPVYVIGPSDLRYSTRPHWKMFPGGLEDFGIVSGAKARTAMIKNGETRLLAEFRANGYPFPRIDDRRIVVDHAKRQVSVDLEADPGPLAVYGPTTIVGTERTRTEYLKRLITWREGAPFDEGQVRATRNALRGTNLFSQIDITYPEQFSGYSMPMTITVSERKARSVGFGGSWSTSEEILGEVFWEHRNFFGNNEKLRLSGHLGTIKLGASAAYRKPNFLRREQSLLADLSLQRQDTEAFDEDAVRTFVGIERALGRHWRVGAGGALEFIEIDGDPDPFLLVGMPLFARADTRDSPLDPTRGLHLELLATPYTGTVGENTHFLAATAGIAGYRALDADNRFILAARAKMGTIVGENLESIPASKRLYAGGGGSVRGFEFQSVGPLDRLDDPTGGRSLFETGIELRTRITETVGLVPFLDGGSVGSGSFLDGDDEFLWSAGLGLRYFTKFAPLRLDIAVPLNRRRVDNEFEFYISMGQAF
jgi:translocation and assembly module TamA